MRQRKTAILTRLFPLKYNFVRKSYNAKKDQIFFQNKIVFSEYIFLLDIR